MSHFIVITEKITAEDLVKLFRDNMWKLHGLPESVISDRGLQFVAGLMKELNEMLEIEMKLLMAFHLQTDRQTKRMNQGLEQYLRMYINHRQGNWLEWLAIVEFAFNNKVYISIKSLPFKVNYEKEPRMGLEIRKKEKHVKTEEFVEEMKEIHEEIKMALIKSQEKMKNLTQQMRNREIKKLMEKFVKLYKIKKIISENAVELELPVLIKIHLVVNVSRIVLYQEQVDE